MGPREKISVVLPTYNEQDNIVGLIQAIHHSLSSVEHEIIVVDDSSDDGTYELAANFQDPRLRIIQRKGSRSLAKSIAQGIDLSSGDRCVVMDSDFNHKPEYLLLMVEALNKYDCACASRFLDGGGMNNRLRHVLSKIFDAFVRCMTGGRVSDNLYGFFAIKKEILRDLPEEKIFWGYGDYYFRLLYYLQKKRARIFQFPAQNGGEEPIRVGFLTQTFFRYFFEVIRLSLKGKVGHQSET